MALVSENRPKAVTVGVLVGTALNEHDLKLYRAVDEVLHYLWDPIGVAGIPGARDEYQMYLPDVFRLVLHGDDEAAIADYLGNVATGRMGLPANRERDLDAARAAIRWRQELA